MWVRPSAAGRGRQPRHGARPVGPGARRRRADPRDRRARRSGPGASPGIVLRRCMDVDRHDPPRGRVASDVDRLARRRAWGYPAVLGRPAVRGAAQSPRVRRRLCSAGRLWPPSWRCDPRLPGRRHCPHRCGYLARGVLRASSRSGELPARAARARDADLRPAGRSRSGVSAALAVETQTRRTARPVRGAGSSCVVARLARARSGRREESRLELRLEREQRAEAVDRLHGSPSLLQQPRRAGCRRPHRRAAPAAPPIGDTHSRALVLERQARRSRSGTP